MQSFIPSCIRSFMDSVIHVSVRSQFARSCIHSFARSFTRPTTTTTTLSAYDLQVFTSSRIPYFRMPRRVREYTYTNILRILTAATRSPYIELQHPVLSPTLEEARLPELQG